MIKEYSLSLITLLKGVLYETQKAAWANLIAYEPDVQNYFSTIGLDLYLDKSEGYAYLRQVVFEEEELPKVAEKRQLNFYVSLLCLVLRKYLLEHDAQGGTVRAIISQQEIINRVKLFMPSATDEAKQQDKIIATINKVIQDMGFLRKLDDNTNNYEVHRIIKGFVNADEIDDTLRRLESFAAEKKNIE